MSDALFRFINQYMVGGGMAENADAPVFLRVDDGAKRRVLASTVLANVENGAVTNYVLNFICIKEPDD